MSRSRHSGWRIAAAATAVALAALAFVGLNAPIGNGDEVIYAENVREMRRSGDLGVLTYQGEPGLLRPAAPFWPVAAISAAIPGELGLRLFAALCSLAVLALVYATARAGWGRRDLALVAAVLCAATPTYALFSRALLSDPPLVVATTFALCATVRAQRDPRWLVGVGVGLGAGVAVKSLAAAVPAAALAPWVVRAVVRHRPWRALAAAVAALVALAAPYFVYSYLRFGDAFVAEHIGLSLGSRVSGDNRVGMDSGVLAYVLHLARVDGPLTLSWMAGAILGGGVLAWRERDGALGICAGYAATVLALLSVIGTRLEHYLLPMYPAAAAAAAGVLAHIARRGARVRPAAGRALVGAIAVAAIAVGLAETPRHLLLPSPPAAALGRAARALSVPGERIYSLDWYAPALGYYADRDWHLLSRAPRVTEHLGGVYLFEKAGNIHGVPPWPRGRIAVAGRRADLARAPLAIERVVAERAGRVLVVARAHGR